MRIVTWNCSGAFRKKHKLLEEFDADLLIIQECEDPARSTSAYSEWAGNHLWVGENKNRGLAVFARNGSSIADLEWNNQGLQLFLPCLVNGNLTVLAVWTKQANSPTFKYIGQLWKYLQVHGEKLATGNVIVAGDFNSNTTWDVWDRWWNHSDVVKELDAMGIKSLYHEIKKEVQGKETTPTLFLHRKQERPYHIDYAFASTHLFDSSSEINVGSSEKWLQYSDHMPLLFEIGETRR